MGEYTLAAIILGACLLLAWFEVAMAKRHKREGATAADWKRARGIVWTGVVLAGLAWLVQRMTGGS